jgi:signal transduction histidine kinase
MRRSVLSDTLGGMAMIRVFIAASFAALILFFAPAAVAAEFGTKEEAVAMVKRVQEKFKKDGAEATFKAVSDKSTPEFHDRDLYPFIYDMKGLNVAHGARPALIGKNLIDLKDQDGKYLIREMVTIANGPGSGWIDYKWPNPINNKIEDKSSYVEKMGGYFVGVGIYKP